MFVFAKPCTGTGPVVWQCRILQLIAAPLLFRTFETLMTTSTAEREVLPLTDTHEKEMGTRLAGAAVSPLLKPFVLLQGCCAVIVALTAWSWARTENARTTVHSLRAGVAAIALASVVAAWPLAQGVSRLRWERYSTDPSVAAAAKADLSVARLRSYTEHDHAVIDHQPHGVGAAPGQA